MATKKRKSGRKLGKTENISIRLDPRLKWTAELGARVHRQPLSSFLEWCLVNTLSDVRTSRGDTVLDIGEATWDIDPDDRVKRLAKEYPELLTYPESEECKARQKEKPRLLVPATN
jgi:hypothetical protein